MRKGRKQDEIGPDLPKSARSKHIGKSPVGQENRVGVDFVPRYDIASQWIQGIVLKNDNPPAGPQDAIGLGQKDWPLRRRNMVHDTDCQHDVEGLPGER